MRGKASLTKKSPGGGRGAAALSALCGALTWAALCLFTPAPAWAIESPDIVGTAERDWLELARRYAASEDIITTGQPEAPDRWEELLKERKERPGKSGKSGKPGKKSRKADAQGPNDREADDQETPYQAGGLARWWDSFGDETLTRLIQRAFKDNRELRSARAKVAEARAQLGITRAGFLPWFDAGASLTHTDSSENGPNQGETSNLYRLGIDASWEIDVSGSRLEATRADRASLEAQYASLHNAWVTLSAEVAMDYVSLRALQARLAVARKNIEVQEDVLAMLRSQHEAGLKDELAVQQARYTLERTKAAVPSIEQSIEEVTNALAVLTGELPGSLGILLAEPGPIPTADAARLVGIPAEALRQRPDIRAAEREWAAQIARRRSAQRDRLPRLSLTGSIGLESLSTGSLLSSESWFLSLIPQITWPLFHGGAIRQNIKVQSAREEQALAAFEQSVLRAVAEVRNALAANAQEALKGKALQSGLSAAEAALDVARDKYDQGLTDFNNVLSAMEAVYSLEDDCAVSEGQRMTNLVMLFKALGGGWAPLHGRAWDALSADVAQ